MALTYKDSSGTSQTVAASAGKTGGVSEWLQSQELAYVDNSGNTVRYGFGQKAMATSFPVVLPSDQSAIPITVASLPLPAGAATAAKQPALGTAGVSATDVLSVQGIASGTAMPVSAASLPLPAGASTAAKQPALGTAGTASADVISVQGVASMTPLLFQGAIAAGVTDSGNPNKIGAVAQNAEVAALTTGQRANLVADLVGKLIVLPYANPENFISGNTAADITGTGSTAVIAAQTTGVRSYITQILVTNMHASVDTRVDILDGATVLYTGFAAHGGGGFSVNLPVPLRGTAATAVNAQCGTTGAQVRVSASGYKGV